MSSQGSGNSHRTFNVKDTELPVRKLGLGILWTPLSRTTACILHSQSIHAAGYSLMQFSLSPFAQEWLCLTPRMKPAASQL